MSSPSKDEDLLLERLNHERRSLEQAACPTCKDHGSVHAESIVPASAWTEDGLPRLAYQAKEVATMFDVTTQTIYRMVDDGELSAVKIGGRNIRILRSSIEKYIANNIVQ